MFWTDKKQINEELQEIRQRVAEIHTKLTQTDSACLDSSCNAEISFSEIMDKLCLIEERTEQIIDEFPKLNLYDLTKLVAAIEHRAEDNATMYKKAEVLVNEVKGMLAIMRAVLKSSKVAKTAAKAKKAKATVVNHI